MSLFQRLRRSYQAFISAEEEPASPAPMPPQVEPAHPAPKLLQVKRPALKEGQIDVRDLIAWVHGEPLIDRHPFAAVKAFPLTTTAPEVWILGSSDYGAQVAALFGLPYCYAWFFSDGAGGERAIDIYKRTYRPSARHPEPRSGLCVWALAAATMEVAQYHFTSRALSRMNRDRGI